MEKVIFVVIAVSLAYGVGCLGRNRKSDWLGILFIFSEYTSWANCCTLFQKEE